MKNRCGGVFIGRFIFALLSLALPVLVFSYGNSPPPTNYTGSPLFGEPNCTDCHTGTPVNSSFGKVTIGAPANYTPGSTVPVQVTITDTGSPQRQRWGFEMSARFRSGSQAGSFAPSGGNTAVQTSTWKCCSIQYASHSTAVRQPGTFFTYTVNWTAPPDASNGDVVFDAAGNAANGDNDTTGDRIYTTEFISSPPAPPAVSSGGVVNGASFLPAPNNQVAPGQLVSIFGLRLTDNNGPYGAVAFPLPTQLGPTKVKVGAGALALDVPLIFVSDKQINAQLPFEAPSSGTQPLVVTVGSSGSAPENVLLAAASPGIFTVTQNGTGNGAILHADNTLVDSSRPARANETLQIFCTGLGATNPAGSTGKPANGEMVVTQPTVTMGGQNAPVAFAGLAPGFAGLYQVNAVVPTVTGTVEVLIKAGSATSRSGVTIPVQ